MYGSRMEQGYPEECLTTTEILKLLLQESDALRGHDGQALSAPCWWAPFRILFQLTDSHCH
jgi:hypothetical protein